jgi:hemoglobin
MRTLRRAGLAALAACLAATALAADKPDAKAIDAAWRKNLYDLINAGAEAWNKGDQESCCQIFENALVTSELILGHHPELQAYIHSGLGKVKDSKNYEQAAFKMRELLDDVRESLRNGGAVPDKRTLWERLGGEKGVTKIIDEFVDTTMKNPKVNFDRGASIKMDAAAVAKFKKSLVDTVSTVAGGPRRYEGKSMKAIHASMAITSAEYDAMKDDLKKTLEKNDVKADDVKAVLEVIEALRKDIVAPRIEVLRTAWLRLGAEKGVQQIVDDWIELAKDDKAVNLDRGGSVKWTKAVREKLRDELVRQISFHTEGTEKPDKDSKPWKGLGITQSEFDAGAKLFKKVLEKHSVKTEDINDLMSKLNALRDSIAEGGSGKPPDTTDKKDTLWERLGGEAGVTKIVNDFLATAAEDKKANLDRGKKLEEALAEIRVHLRGQISSLSKGPIEYDPEKATTKGMLVTEGEFDARKEHLKKALEKEGVKADDVKAVMEGYEALRKYLVEQKKPDDKPKEAEISGKVTYDGKPLTSGKIHYEGPDKKPLSGAIDKDGAFKVTGLVVGVKYKVYVQTDDKVPQNYTTVETTPLVVTIAKEKDTQNWEIKK